MGFVCLCCLSDTVNWFETHVVDIQDEFVMNWAIIPTIELQGNVYFVWKRGRISSLSRIFATEMRPPNCVFSKKLSWTSFPLHTNGECILFKKSDEWFIGGRMNYAAYNTFLSKDNNSKSSSFLSYIIISTTFTAKF